MSKTALELKKLSPTEKVLFAYLDEMLREGTESPAAAIVEPVAPAPAVVKPAVAAPAQITAPPPVSTPPVAPPSVPVTARVSEKPVIAPRNPVQPMAAPTQAPTAPKAVPVPAPAPAPVVAPAQSPLAGSAPVAVPVPTSMPRSEPLSRVQVQAPAIIVPATDRKDTAVADGVVNSPGWADNGRPVWAQSRFDVLIFKVAGLKLAVPLVSLGLIHPIDKKFHALPHQTDWFLGLLRVQGGNIKVIDTARHVMPERYTPACRENLKFVITLHGYEWGLACHEVDKAMCLEPEAVNWRTQRSKRPWMAGTVREHMCALIDAVGFHQVIESVERNSDE